MEDVTNAHAKQITWNLVPREPHHNIVGMKWVYHLKYDSDGDVSKRKARLVAKRYEQHSRLDFPETFSQWPNTQL